MIRVYVDFVAEVEVGVGGAVVLVHFELLFHVLEVGFHCLIEGINAVLFLDVPLAWVMRSRTVSYHSEFLKMACSRITAKHCSTKETIS